VGCGLGNCIHTESVPGIGAIILRDLDFNDNLISFVSASIFDIVIPASGFILICTIDGHKSNHSILIATLNSISLSCSDFAFSMRNFSSIVADPPALDFNKEISNVGLSHEKLIVGLGLFSSNFSSTFCFIIFLIKELDIDLEGYCIPKSCFVSFIFLAISSVVCLSDLDTEDDFGLEYFSNFRFILGIEKFKVYNTQIIQATNKITIKDLTAIG
jgi:hypothetical protein